MRMGPQENSSFVPSGPSSHLVNETSGERLEVPEKELQLEHETLDGRSEEDKFSSRA